jgi:Mor family transcriptional regulator
MDTALLREVAQFHPKELMPPYDTLMERHGFEVICSIVELFGGATIYVPALRTIVFGCMEKDAHREFTGTNSLEIARKYGFTQRHMRRIMGLA